MGALIAGLGRTQLDELLPAAAATRRAQSSPTRSAPARGERAAAPRPRAAGRLRLRAQQRPARRRASSRSSARSLALAADRAQAPRLSAAEVAAAAGDAGAERRSPPERRPRPSASSVRATIRGGAAARQRRRPTASPSCARRATSSGSTSWLRRPTRSRRAGELLRLARAGDRGHAALRPAPEARRVRRLRRCSCSTGCTGGHDVLPVEVHCYISRRATWSPCAAGRASTSTRPRRALADHSSDIEEYIVYRVLDALTDSFFPVVQQIDDKIEAMEDEAMTEAANSDRLAHGLRAASATSPTSAASSSPSATCSPRGGDLIQRLPGLEQRHGTRLLPGRVRPPRANRRAGRRRTRRPHRRRSRSGSACAACAWTS